MSHFLSRLVQRSFGEVATVRPAPLPVTAPDVGAPAWDEQVLMSDSPRLVRRAVAYAASSPRGLPPPAPPPLAAPRPGAPPAAPAALDAPAPLASAAATHAPAVATHAPAAPAVVRAATPAVVPSIVARATPLASAAHAPDGVSAAAPAETSPRDAVVTAPVDVQGLPAVALFAHPADARDEGAASPGRGAPELRAHAPVAVVERDGAPASTPAVAAARADAPRTSPRAAPNPPTSAAPAAAAPVRLAPAPPPPRGGPGAPQRADPHVVEDRTTVEVSIGRIEVRLAARPTPTAAGAAPSRRPAVGLADYLRARDERGRS